jgi:hypothetical protein
VKKENWGGMAEISGAGIESGEFRVTNGEYGGENDRRECLRSNEINWLNA